MSMELFKSLSGLTPDQFSGKEKIPGNLYLGSLTSIPDGFNPTVGGSLDLRSLTSIPDGFNPTVGGPLDLRSLTSIPDGFNPTVGGNLDLGSLTSIPDGFNPTVGDNLYLDSLTSIPDGFNPTVGGNLDLDSLTSIPDGFNPTVGGNLDLRSLTSIPDGFNPTVGGNLYLRSLTSIPDGFNPTVGGNLYLDSLTAIKRDSLMGKLRRPAFPFRWNGHILADGILAKVLHEHGPALRVQVVGRRESSYLVTDGQNWSHGATLDEVRDSLVYKTTDRNPEQYRGLGLDSSLTFAEAVACYRTITGACAAGVRHFVESTSAPREGITVRKILEITRGRYGHEVFAAFFNESCAITNQGKSL